jgi:hypothetical protein
MVVSTHVQSFLISFKKMQLPYPSPSVSLHRRQRRLMPRNRNLGWNKICGKTEMGIEEENRYIKVLTSKRGNLS